MRWVRVPLVADDDDDEDVDGDDDGDEPDEESAATDGVGRFETIRAEALECTDA